jgi:hypothetical protein
MINQTDVLGGGDPDTFNRPIVSPRAPRHIHIDPSLTGDATGFCMAHISEWVNVVRKDEDGTQFTERAPVIFVDLMLRIVPPIGDEIVLGDVRKLIYQLSKRGYMITSVTMDSWGNGAHDGVQKLNQKGFNASILSIDKTMGPYELLKGALYEDRVNLYPYPVLLKELRELERDWVKRKVDHPSGGSKDLSDALAGVVSTLTDASSSIPIPFVRSPSVYEGDQWLQEQEQHALAAVNSPAYEEEMESFGVLPPFLIGGIGPDPNEW